MGVLRVVVRRSKYFGTIISVCVSEYLLLTALHGLADKKQNTFHVHDSTVVGYRRFSKGGDGIQTDS